MDLPDPLRRAAVMVPRSASSEARTTVMDAVEYLDHHEDEVALDILTRVE
jgi:hypothetical protein